LPFKELMAVHLAPPAAEDQWQAQRVRCYRVPLLRFWCAGRAAAHGAARQRPTIRGVIASTVRAEGILGLYRGIGPTLCGILPYAGLKFYVYQSLKQEYRRFDTKSCLSDACMLGNPARVSTLVFSICISIFLCV